MLRKFISIQNVGRFLDYHAAGDVELKKFSLFFAENGRGKSTLCALLRSLQSGDASYIVGRSTLGDNGTPSVELLLESGTAAFDGAHWTTTFPALEIFDSTFISENVYSGDTVELEHRRNLYNVIIGKEGVELARRIDELDDATRSKSTEIREELAALQAIVPQGMSLEQFRELEADAAIDTKIQIADAELQRLKEADRIKNREALSALALPALPSGVPALLTREFEGLATDAQRRVADQIQAHAMHEAGEAWLSQGLDFVVDDTCPFCGQDLDAVQGLLEAYKAYFGEAYRALLTEIDLKRQEILSDLGDRAIAGFEKIFDQNNAGIEFWSRYCEVSLPTLSVDDMPASGILRKLRQTAVTLLDQKSATPLEVISVDDLYSGAEAKLQKLQTQVDIYNKSVSDANATIEKTKSAIEAADLKEVENTLWLMRATKKRHESTVNETFTAHDIAVKEKMSLERSKEEAKNRLDARSSEVMKRYEETINHLLDDINAGFRITNATHAYPGGIAATSYQILINDTPFNLGDGSTPIGQPSFRNTLSSGDRNTLAIAFFLARLEHDADKANKVVVFDDPFNSQDRFRKEWTVQKMKQVGESSRQVLVLSHDEMFLARVWNRLATDSDVRKSLQLARVGERNTRIVYWDIKAATESAQSADRRALVGFYTEGLGALDDIVKRIRPFLETHLRLLAPDEFTDDALGEIVGKIRETGESHSLYPLLADLDLLNEYTRRYHHGDSPDKTREPIEETELQGFVKIALRIAGG